MRKYIITFLFFIPFGVFAQDTLGLEDIIKTGLESNYGIRVQKLNCEISSINNHWGNTGLLPSLNLSANSGNKFTGYPDSDQDIASMPYVDYMQNSLMGSVSLSWMLFDGFQPFIRKEKLNTLEALTEGNTEALIESNLQAIILAYYKVLLEKEKKDVYETQMKLSADRYEYDKVRKEYGKATTYDLLQSQNAMLQDKTSFVTQEVTLKNSMKDLYLLLGVADSVQFEIYGTLPDLNNEYALADLEAKMLKNNKNLKNQYLNIEMMKQETELAIREMYYPKLSMQAGVDYAMGTNSYKTTPETEQSLNYWDYYGNFSLTFNLYGGGQKRRAVKIAKINKQISEIKTSEMEHSLSNQLEKLFELYLIRKELLNLSNEMLAAAKLNYEMSEERYKQGIINSFNFRDIQLMYLDIAIRQKEAVFGLLQTDTDLLRITGGIINNYGSTVDGE